MKKNTNVFYRENFFVKVINPFCLLVGILSVFLVSCQNKTGQENKDPVSKKGHFEQYLVGIKYLEMATDLPVEKKIAYYNTLVELTGFTAASALQYGEHYTDKPEKWEKVIKAIVAEVDSLPSNRKE